MKFLGKMSLIIRLKVTNKQGLTLSLEDTFFKKPQGVQRLHDTLKLKHFNLLFFKMSLRFCTSNYISTYRTLNLLFINSTY